MSEPEHLKGVTAYRVDTYDEEIFCVQDNHNRVVCVCYEQFDAEMIQRCLTWALLFHRGHE